MRKINLVRRSIKPTDDKLITYMMELEVVSAEDIDKHIFVKQRFRRPDGTFDDRFAAVASPAQLEDLDVNSPREDSTYFRSSKVQLTHTSLVYLDYIWNTIVTDVSMLVEDAAAMSVLEEEETVTVTATSTTSTVSTTPAVQNTGEYRAISIDNPAVDDNLTMFYTTKNITVGKVISLVNGSAEPSVTWTIRYGPNRSLAGTELKTGGFVTTNNTFGQLDSTFTNPVIPGGSFIWILVTDKNGSVTSLDITIIFG
jgi:hypothetical protein